eukprot:1027761_1
MASLIAQWIETGNKPKFREIEISKTYNHAYRLVVGYLRINDIIFDDLAPIIKQLLLYYSIPLTIKDMGKHAFYRWVSECAPNGVATNNIDELMHYILENNIDGAQIIRRCRNGSNLSLLLCSRSTQSMKPFLNFIKNVPIHIWMHFFRNQAIYIRTSGTENC